MQTQQNQLDEKKEQKLSEDPQFKAEVDKIQTFCEALTEDERNCLFKDDPYKSFNIEEYRKKFASWYGLDNAIKHAQEFLESLQEDLAGFHLLKDLQASGLSIPKLLVRFIKLPEIFRTYLRMSVIAESMRETHKDSQFDFDEPENITDEVFIQQLVAIELSSKDKFKYLKQLVFTLKILDTKLQEFESAQTGERKQVSEFPEVQTGSPTGTRGYRAGVQNN